jgi:hypothetical protein
MWQMCSYVPQSLLSGALSEDKLAELTASFFLETFVHAKEKVHHKNDPFGIEIN